MSDPQNNAPGQSPDNAAAPKPATKPSLRMRKEDAPPAFTPIEKPDQPAPVITHFKPAKPAKSFSITPFIAPVLLTAVIAGGGYFGYSKLTEQSARVVKAEAAAADAESLRESARRQLSDLDTAVRDAERACTEAERAIVAEKEKAVREAPGLAEAEFRPKFDEIATKLADAKRGIAEAERTAEGKAREAVTTAQKQVAELAPKVAEMEKQIADLKAWLNANTRVWRPKL